MTSVKVSADGLTATFQCSKVGMTHVIGKGGSSIKAIQSETGAKLDTQVNDADPKKATIAVTGASKDVVAQAQARIQKILDEQVRPYTIQFPRPSSLHHSS